jgi:amino acid adenylation domain-containing protein/non-ribosomal peptide synthase protein (TIGR01720 family)
MNKKLVHSVFAHIAARFPEHIAIEEENCSIDYRTLNRRADSLAHQLRAEGIGSGSVVGLFLPPGIDYVLSLLAVLKAGGVFLPLDVDSPEKRLRFLLKKAEPSVIITQTGLQHVLAQRTALDQSGKKTEYTCLCVDGTEQAQSAEDFSTDDLEAVADPDGGCYLLFTSGSTGEPKAILGRHKSLSHFIHWEIKEFQLDHRVRVSLLAAPTFDVSLRDIFIPLLTGGTLCIPSPATRSSASGLFAWIRTTQLHLIHCVPSLFRLISRELAHQPDPRTALPDLQTVFLAGEPVYGQDVREWYSLTGRRPALVNLYGPSECTLAKVFFRIPDSAWEPQAIIPLGQPIANTALLILRNNRLCGIGERGELYIKTPFLSKGYYKDEALSSAVFVQNPLNPEPDLIYRTGDQARYLEDRSVEFLGRLDNQVKINGIRIELGEVEQAALQYPAVQQAVVIAHTPGRTSAQATGPVLVCYYTAAQELPQETLRDHLRQYLPEYMIPPFLVQLQEFILNQHGKVDRRALPQPEELLYQRIPYQAPKNQTEEKLATIWGEILGLEKVGVQSPFIELGGDSLKALRMLSKIYKVFGVELSLRDFFAVPTIAGLSQLLAERDQVTFQPIPAQPEQEDYPVSHAQKRLWTLQQLDIDARAYNLPAAFRLKGPCDVDAFSTALHQLTERHEALRTCFVSQGDGEVRQKVQQAPGIDLQIIDLRGENNPEVQAEQAVQEDRLQPFDLSVAPLLRVKLIRLDESSNLLLFNIHHIICDVWSLDILVREFATYYHAARQGGVPNKIQPLEIQYKDYSVWQNSLLADKQGEQQRQYWLNQLRAPLPQLDVPTDYVRPAVQTFSGDTAHLVLDTNLLTALQKLSQHCEASLFMTLTALVRVLLYRYTGQEDLILGVPVAGRQHPDLESQVGLYVNTLALREQLRPAEPFIIFLDRIKRSTAAAYDHQLYPFDRLVDELELERDMSHAPLFDVMVMLQNVAPVDLQLDGLEILPWDEENHWETSRFDLMFHFMEQNEGLRLDLNFNTDLFTPERIQNMLKHLEQLAAAVCQDEQQAPSALPMLGNEEQELLLKHFQRQSTRPATCPAGDTLIDCFVRQVKQGPEHPAMLLEGHQLSYQELNASADQIAFFLRHRARVHEGDIVGVAAGRTLSAPIALLGVLKAGCLYLPLDPGYPEERIRYMLEDSRCQIVLADSTCIDTLGDCTAEFFTVQEALEIEQESEAESSQVDGLATRQSHDPAFVIYTSGSTGQPKGVVLEHKGFINMILDQLGHFSITPQDRVLQFASAGFDAALYESFIAWLGGASLVLVPQEVIEHTEGFTEYLETQGVTTAVLPPVYLHALQQHPLPSLRNIMTVGEPAIVADALFYARSRKYLNGYGPTEGSVCAAVHQIDPEQDYPQGIPVGRPTANTPVYILDTELNLLPVGIPGEICIGGVGVNRGYLYKEDLTQERFIANPFRPGERMYCTGDTGYWSWNGEIVFTGREDDQVKIAGHRIEPEEIALTLRRHPAVRDAAVFAVEDSSGKILLAYYTTEKNSAELSGQELRTFLAARVPNYMLPAWFVPLENLPLTANGKVDRKALPSLQELKQHRDAAPALPGNDMEERVAGAWKAVLGLDTIDIHENFFSLGGDSIKAIQIAAHLHNNGLCLETQTILHFPTVAQQAMEVKSVERSIPQEPVTGTVPLTPIQSWFFSRPDWENSEPHHFNQAVLLRTTENLEHEVLRQSIQALQTHHDALRMCYILPTDEAHKVLQKNAAPDACPVALERIDLLDHPEPSVAAENAANVLQSGIDLTTGPLLRALHLLLPEGDAILLVVHHLVVDTVSWQILLQDFTTAYTQLLAGQPVGLPLKTDSFQRAAQKLQEYASGKALQEERGYWEKLLASAPAPLVKDQETAENTEAQSAVLTRSLDETETTQLLTAAHQAYHTRMDDLLLTGLALALQDWQGRQSTLIELERHGREPLFPDLDITRTVGWFTSTHPFRLTLPLDHDLGYCIKYTKEALRSIPKNGVGYGVLRYLAQSRLDVPYSPQISFNYLGEISAAEPGRFRQDVDHTGRTVSPQAPRPYDLAILCAVSEGRFSISLSYHKQQYLLTSVEQFMDRYLHSLRTVIAHCTGCQSTELTPSDLTYKDLSLEELEELF